MIENEKILVIEDDTAIQDILQDFLENAGYTVELAADGLEGYEKFHSGDYSLLLLDILMPKIDGYTLLEMLRKESEIPVILLTALSKEEEEVRGFDLKADDYITKPFSYAVLLKRVEAALRKNKTNSNSEEENNHKNLSFGELAMDTSRCEVYVSNQLINLTATEYAILKLMLENRSRLFSRQNLLDSIWGKDYYGGEKIIDNHIKNIRRKLDMDIIETVRGMGYRIA